jgi:hypothetical protein
MSAASQVTLARRAAAWAITGVLCVLVLTLGLDLALVAWRVHLRPHVLGAALADGIALASIVALVVAPLAAALETWCARIARGAWRALWPMPVASTAAFVGLVVSGLVLYGRTGANAVVIAGFAAAITAVAVATRDRRPLVALGVPAVVLVGALWATVRLLWLRPDHRDLLAIVVVCGLQGLATPLRRRIARGQEFALAAVVALIAASCLLVLVPAEESLTRWRLESDELARMQPSLRRSARALWDFDFDESSPVFGGGDCDDTTAARNPSRNELPGGVDDNCNGATMLPSPTPADRGLTAAAGTPSPRSGPLDLVVLVTVDCLRSDALDVMPNLQRLSARGVRMSRMYSEGTKTMHSLPFLQRTSLGDVSVAAQLHPTVGFTSTAIIGRGIGHDVALAGFDRSQQPDIGDRWPAGRVTDLALADLDGLHGPHYLWTHYYDAHDPLESRAGDVDGGPLPGPYVREVGVIDREVGRLLDTLEGRGQLARAAVIVTADHGDAFGAHGIPFHAATPYEPLIHVPGIFLAPGVAPMQYGGLVSHRDVPLTVLAAFGVDVADRELFGRSWFRLQDAPAAPLHAFVVSRGSASGMHGRREVPIGAIVTPQRKVIERYDVRSFMLFDPVADPGEEHDLAEAEPETLSRLRRQLATFRDLDPR